MRDLREWLACPACRGSLSPDWTCAACGASFEATDGIPDLRLSGDPGVEFVRRFYNRAPFPGYPVRDDLATFRARAARSQFAQLLDRAIAPDAVIAEIGCGTGQMALYLASVDRAVVAADLSRPALTLGAAAARRYGVSRVQFVETDLHRPGLKPGAFDVVFSSGVLHHTPDPAAAFARVAALARPGGIVVVGVYNTFARVPLRLRRIAARLTRFRHVPFDPILRDRQDEPARRDAWLRDQYQHPEEHRHTVAEVRRWFHGNGLERLRTFPSTVLGDQSGDLFAPASDDWAVEALIAQMEWMWTLNGDGGLFFTIGRRASNADSNHSSLSARRRNSSGTERPPRDADP